MKRGTAITISIVVSLLFAVFFIYPAGMIVKQAFEGTRRDAMAGMHSALVFHQVIA